MCVCVCVCVRACVRVQTSQPSRLLAFTALQTHLNQVLFLWWWLRSFFVCHHQGLALLVFLTIPKESKGHVHNGIDDVSLM